nr:YraN family protein [Anaerolineae bacterium]
MQDGEANNARLSPAEIGELGEQIARQALSTYGYTIVEMNWRCFAGEIDLIALERDVWVFVEVKTRRSEAYGTPEEAVTSDKKRRLFAVAQVYLVENDLTDVDWRIDVVAIALSSTGRVVRLHIHRNAVYAE